ncbi:PREDICTED: extensin-like [Ceratotherium simum simum]|uniref:Extensin-like n=1 Tax=Ceratotherium simum simum TaxID=73337 RepID=A0ABM1DAR6_CERSS|nr:PREDICTED: extensin-like [Ceratotherium simum simum]
MVPDPRRDPSLRVQMAAPQPPAQRRSSDPRHSSRPQAQHPHPRPQARLPTPTPDGRPRPAQARFPDPGRDPPDPTHSSPIPTTDRTSNFRRGTPILDPRRILGGSRPQALFPDPQPETRGPLSPAAFPSPQAQVPPQDSGRRLRTLGGSSRRRMHPAESRRDPRPHRATDRSDPAPPGTHPARAAAAVPASPVYSIAPRPLAPRGPHPILRAQGPRPLVPAVSPLPLSPSPHHSWPAHSARPDSALCDPELGPRRSRSRQVLRIETACTGCSRSHFTHSPALTPRAGC